MKLSRATWIVLAVGVVIIAAVSLYLVYQNQLDRKQLAVDDSNEVKSTLLEVLTQKKGLETELTQLDEEIVRLEASISSAESEVTSASAELDQIEIRFPSFIETIEYDEILFNFAEASNVVITGIFAIETSEETVDDIQYYTTDFVCQIDGEIPDILDFINTITNSDNFRTTLMEPVNISVPELLTEVEKAELTEEEIQKAEMSSATINLSIYTYQGE
jgi:multidrug efflux pump subunit AcrA (membrane-fusion protein)